MIFFFFEGRLRGSFWNLTFKKKISQLKKKYHFSLFLLKKLQFRIIWEREKKWKKPKNATISIAEWKLKCNFQKHTGRDDNAPSPAETSFLAKIVHFKTPKKLKQKYHFEKSSEIVLKKPLVESQNHVIKTFFFSKTEIRL